MTLAPWPRRQVVTDAQARMIHDGAIKARAAGWTQNEWAEDVAALLGVNVRTVKNVIWRCRRRAW